MFEEGATSGGRSAPGGGSALVSVVVPCFNEEAVVEETQRQVLAALEALGLPFEVIYVDDGSRDSTWEKLRAIQAGDARVRAVRLSRNFGHQVASTAGLQHAAGEVVILMDADLQDPPEVIGEMLAKWREGYQVVYGTRVERKGEGRFKAWSAKAFYRVINGIAEIPIPLDTGDFRLMDRKVVDALLAMPERDRFLRGMIAWVGFRQTSVRYVRQPRAAGSSKYPLRKMLHFAGDGMLSFSRAPLKMASVLGFFCSAVAVAGMAYALTVRLTTHAWVAGWASIFLAVLFLGGVQLICLGVIGEYVGRTYGEAKHRPLYFVAETVGWTAQERGREAGAGKS